VKDALLAAERALRQAEQAAAGAELHAGAARLRAGQAEQQTGTAGQQLERAEDAAVAAVRTAGQVDVLLLDTQARRLAAQVGAGQPFGVPGASAGRRSDLHRSFSVTTGALLAVLGGFALYTVRNELVLLLVAAFIAIGLDPAVRWLVRRGLSRPVAVAVIAVIALGLFAGFVAAAFPPLAKEAGQLAQSGPRYARDLQDQHNTLGRSTPNTTPPSGSSRPCRTG